MVCKRVIRKTHGEKLLDIIKKPFVAMGTIAGTILTIATILYYTVTIANGASIKYNKIDAVEEAVKVHVSEQIVQFRTLDSKIEKMDDKNDVQFEKINDKLYKIVQALSRVEHATKSKETSITTGEIVKDISPRDKSEVVFYKKLDLNQNKEN